jgi:hypothetical protein
MSDLASRLFPLTQGYMYLFQLRVDLQELLLIDDA